MVTYTKVHIPINYFRYCKDLQRFYCLETLVTDHMFSEYGFTQMPDKIIIKGIQKMLSFYTLVNFVLVFIDMPKLILLYKM